MNAITETRPRVSDNDLRVLEIVSQSSPISQRDLAKQSGLSVGMVNLVLKRLATTGYIKIVNLDRRKMKYLLTPKGLAEKYDRSYNYFLRTLRVYNQFQSRIKDLLESEIAKGRTHFMIRGGGDTADLIKMLLAGYGNNIQLRISAAPYHEIPSKDEVILDCRINGNEAAEGISVLEAILRHNTDISLGESHYELV